jgi:hypothetical protein
VTAVRAAKTAVNDREVSYPCMGVQTTLPDAPKPRGIDIRPDARLVAGVVRQFKATAVSQSSMPLALLHKWNFRRKRAE